MHTAANMPPTASVSASPASGPAPLAVTLNGGASRDPEGGALRYEWNFGDGSALTTTTATISHSYAAGSYTASLVVIDPPGARSAPATAAITSGAANTPPTVSISAPTTFKVGDTITVTGSATDVQQASFPATAFSWTVLRHHDTHTHPWASGTGTSFSFPAPAPEDLAAAANSFVEVQLRVTDNGGLATTATRTVQPRKVALTVATTPNGLQVLVNGTSFTGPSTFTSWEGWTITLEAPSPQILFYRFRTWSDAGARVHTVVTPALATTYRATFAFALF